MSDDRIVDAAERLRRQWAAEQPEKDRKAAEQAEALRRHQELWQSRHEQNEELLWKFVRWARKNNIPYDVRDRWKLSSGQIEGTYGPDTIQLFVDKKGRHEADLGAFDPEVTRAFIAEHVARSGKRWP